MIDILDGVGFWNPVYDAAGEGSGGEGEGEGDLKKGEGEGEGSGEGDGAGEGEGEGKEAAGKAKSLLDAGEGEGEGEGSGEEGSDPWGDMKSKIAGDDTKIMSRLNRYGTFETFAKAGLAAQEKIRSGEFVKPLGDDATDKELAAFRKDNGIPEASGGYEVPEVKGFEWKETDKPMLDAFREHMHGVNATPDQFNHATEFYAKAQMAKAQEIFDKDTQANTELEDHLRVELGPRYRGTINLMARYVGDDKEGFGSVPEIMEARLPDGRRLGDISDFVTKIAQLGHDVYGEGAMISGHEADTMKSRKEEIETIMSTDIDRYYLEKMDVEMMKILEKEEGSNRRVA